MRPPIAWPLTLLLALAPGPAGAVDPPSPVLRGADPAQFDLVGIGPGSIAIVDGEVRLTGRPLGYLATKEVYGDFALSFEWKYDRPADLRSDAGFRGNSGVLLRIAGPPRVWPRCVQIQLAQADPGAIFLVGDGRFEGRMDHAAREKATRPVGEWNRAEVTCRGRQVVCALNGVEVARGEGDLADRGPIGWQSEGQPVRFREIRIGALP